MSFDIKIGEIMDKEPLVVTLEEDLASVASKMAHLNKETAIVLEGRDVKGILKFTDLCFAIKTFILGKLFTEKIPLDIRLMQMRELMQNPTIKEICDKCGFSRTGQPVSIEENSTVADAIEVMAMSGLDHLLVRRDEGRLGLVTDHDLIGAFKEIFPAGEA